MSIHDLLDQIANRVISELSPETKTMIRDEYHGHALETDDPDEVTHFLIYMSLLKGIDLK